MSYKMTKRGSLDNEISNEFICDTIEDMNKIDNKYRTLGSIAMVISGDTGFEVYMANSQHEWKSLTATVTEEEENNETVQLILSVEANPSDAKSLTLNNHTITGEIYPITVMPGWMYFTVPDITEFNYHIYIGENPFDQDKLVCFGHYSSGWAYIDLVHDSDATDENLLRMYLVDYYSKIKFVKITASEYEDIENNDYWSDEWQNKLENLPAVDEYTMNFTTVEKE